MCLGRVLGSSWTPFGPSGRHLEASWGAEDARKGPKSKQKRDEKRNKPFSKKHGKNMCQNLFFHRLGGLPIEFYNKNRRWREEKIEGDVQDTLGNGLGGSWKPRGAA